MHPRRMTSLAALVGLEVAALIALHHLGSYEATAIEWGNLSGWLSRAAPENALVAVVRLAALALAWWLAASTLLYLLASVTRIPALLRGVRWATVAPVRRMIDGALATTIVVGSTFGTVGVATASPAIRPAVVLELDQPNGGSGEARPPMYQPRPAGGGARSEYHPTPAGGSTPQSVPMPDDSLSSTQSRNAKDKSSTIALHTVRPGDNLWNIAAGHLAKSSRRPGELLTTEDVRSYWSLIVDANENQLRSDDANLIVPGELIELPKRRARRSR